MGDMDPKLRQSLRDCAEKLKQLDAEHDFLKKIRQLPPSMLPVEKYVTLGEMMEQISEESIALVQSFVTQVEPYDTEAA